MLVEVCCVLFVLYLLFRKPFHPKASEKLTKEEEEELLREWKPQPLVPELPARYKKAHKTLVVEGTTDALVSAGGRLVHNFASFNFLGIASCPEIKQACHTTISKYGVGSCGPRGFYGTIDVHLDLEKKIAAFFGTEEAILYSDGLACVSSVIPAFSKAGDLIICDEACNFHIQQGLLLSRSTVKYYKHNDMEDLEKILISVQEQDKRERRKLNRRFIITEGLFQNYGDLCPLSKIVELKEKYKYRLIMDDSMAFGVLGATGRGSPEHWGIPFNHVDIYCATMDAALATVGGFVTGTHEVCNHQRLSGAGYCFSASSPPYSVTAGLVALDLIDSDKSRLQKLRHNATRLRVGLSNLAGVQIDGPEFSPIVHIRMSPPLASEDEEADLLEAVCDQLMSEDIVVCTSQYIPQEKRQPRPSIRVLVTANHKEQDIDHMVDRLKLAFRQSRVKSHGNEEKEQL